MSLIDVASISRHYPGRTAITDVSFGVERGEILGFLGPNGAGKTTTMRILTGYVPPSSGTARIDGHDVVTDSLAARRLVGYLPELVPLYDDMRVKDYLHYMARLRQVGQRRTAVARAMELVQITDRANDRIATLSRGYRQRVGLAQALVHDPPVLILDEPTVGLDPRQIAEVRALIRDLARERTVILSTHILPEVSQVCDRVLIMREGRIVASDTPQGLAERATGALSVVVEVTQPSAETASALRAVPGVEGVSEGGNGSFKLSCVPGADVRNAVATLIVTRGWGLHELRTERASLEDVFLQLTTDEPAPEVLHA